MMILKLRTMIRLLWGETTPGNMFGGVDSLQMVDTEFKEKNIQEIGRANFLRGDNTSTNSGNNGKIEPSPQGANKLNHRGFKSKAVLNNHWNKHSNEFPEEFSNKAEYFEYSINLLESSTSDTISGHINRLGQIIRFDKEKNLFVKGSIEKGNILQCLVPKDWG